MGGACGAGGGASVDDIFFALPSTLRPLPENGCTFGLVSCAFLAARSAASLAKSNVPIFSFSGVPSAPLRFPVVWPVVDVMDDDDEEEEEEEEVAPGTTARLLPLSSFVSPEEPAAKPPAAEPAANPAACALVYASRGITTVAIGKFSSSTSSGFS